MLMYFMFRMDTCVLEFRLLLLTEHVSEAENGAGTKSGERERSGERTFQKTLERERCAEQGR